MVVDNLLQFKIGGDETMALAAINASGLATDELELGRGGLPDGAYFEASLDTVLAVPLFVDLELASNGAFPAAAATASPETIATIFFPAGSKGLRSTAIRTPFPSEFYTNADIEVRVVFRSSGDVPACNGAARITNGAPTFFGRAATTDTVVEIT